MTDAKKSKFTAAVTEKKPFTLPALSSAADCQSAYSAVTAAAHDGRISLNDADKMGRIISDYASVAASTRLDREAKYPVPLMRRKIPT